MNAVQTLEAALPGVQPLFAGAEKNYKFWKDKQHVAQQEEAQTFS